MKIDKEKLVEEVQKVYLAEDISEDIEKVKSNLYYWEWVDEQATRIKKALKSVNYHAFSIEMHTSGVRGYIENAKTKIVNLSKDFQFEAKTAYPDLASTIIAGARGLNDSIIGDQPEFIKKEVFVAIGKAAYYAADNYVIDQEPKFWEEAPLDVDEDMMKRWKENYASGYEYATKNIMKKY